MRLVYKKGTINHLRRSKIQKWHLLRNMFTQLIMHERIRTTNAKAEALQIQATKFFRMAINGVRKKNKGLYKR